MWSEILGYVRELLTLQHEVTRHTQEIRELREEMGELADDVRALTLEVQQLRFDIKLVKQSEEHERRELTLKLEKHLLLFERRLPAGPPASPPQEE